MAPKVLILTGDAGETLEVYYPYQRLLEEGYEVHIAAPVKKRLQFVVHDFAEGFDTYSEKAGHCCQADVAFADVDPSNYVACVIPGGRAPEYIRNDQDCQRIVRAFFSTNRPIAQLCHGPLVSAAAGVLKGRTTAAYPDIQPDITVAGATFQDEEVVVDELLVSGRAWPDHPGWMREFMRVLRQYAPVEAESPTSSEIAAPREALGALT
jgi:protease I